MAKLSLNGQITELDWTIDQMKKWNDHCVNTRKLKQREADLHNLQLSVVMDTMNWFADNEAYIRWCFAHREELTVMMDADTAKEKASVTQPA